MNHRIQTSALAILMIASVMIGSACGQTNEVAENSDLAKLQKANLGSTPAVHHVGRLFTAGQFQPTDIHIIKKNSISRVISLRTEGELKWDEAATLKAAGIEFHNIPFKTPEGMTDEVFNAVRELLKDDRKTTLLHCATANRAVGVWIPFRALDQGVPLEDALEEAKEMGLSIEFIRDKAIAYVVDQQFEMKKATEAADAREERSVKPGINSSFLDPELEVQKFLDRFEIESREIYSAQEAILSACDISPRDVVADVGSGTGLFTKLFSKSAGEAGWVYAIDISPRFLEHINKDSKNYAHSNVTGVLCAENSVNLPPASVDVVFICDTYHHFEYPKSTMASIHRALRQDGHLIVIDFERIEGKTREWLMNHVRAGKEVFRAEIQDAGFTLVEEKKIEGLKENYFLKFKKSE